MTHRPLPRPQSYRRIPGWRLHGRFLRRPGHSGSGHVGSGPLSPFAQVHGLPLQMPGSSPRVLGRGQASWLVSSATLRFALRITRLGVLSFPFPLLFLCKEPHLGWFALDAPAVFHHPHVTIDLHLVQGALLVFAVPGFKSDGVLLLRALDRCTEIGIEPRPMILEKHELFIEARRIEL